MPWLAKGSPCGAQRPFSLSSIQCDGANMRFRCFLGPGGVPVLVCFVCVCVFSCVGLFLY